MNLVRAILKLLAGPACVTPGCGRSAACLYFPAGGIVGGVVYLAGRSRWLCRGCYDREFPR